MLIHSASQLLTLAGGPQRGAELGRLGIIQDGALLIDGREDRRSWYEPPSCARHTRNEPALDAGGKVVMPGFVDPHTHAIWAGDRAGEFEQRLEGKTYLEILAAGGGILSTVHATRTSSLENLLAETRPPPVEHVRIRHHHGGDQNRLWAAHRHRAAYAAGADRRSTRKARSRLRHLSGRPCHRPRIQGSAGRIHTAPDRRDHAAGSVGMVAAPGPLPEMPFVDVFCETGAFSLAQSRAHPGNGRSVGFSAQNPRRRV